MSREAIEDRRQRAREAFYDTPGCVADPDTALTEAIETATLVKITEEAIEAFDVERNGSTDAGDIRAGLAAALAELGFEVED